MQCILDVIKMEDVRVNIWMYRRICHPDIELIRFVNLISVRESEYFYYQIFSCGEKSQIFLTQFF